MRRGLPWEGENGCGGTKRQLTCTRSQIVIKTASREGAALYVTQPATMEARSTNTGNAIIWGPLAGPALVDPPPAGRPDVSQEGERGDHRTRAGGPSTVTAPKEWQEWTRPSGVAKSWPHAARTPGDRRGGIFATPSSFPRTLRSRASFRFDRQSPAQA
jgi:hypothetical protein